FFLLIVIVPHPPSSLLFPYTTLFRSVLEDEGLLDLSPAYEVFAQPSLNAFMALGPAVWTKTRAAISALLRHDNPRLRDDKPLRRDRKSTRLNSSHDQTSYAVFCLKKK